MSSNPPEWKFLNFVGSYSCGPVNLWKERERELATPLVKNLTSTVRIMLKLVSAIKIECKNWGGEGRIAVTTACPRAGKKICV